MTKGILLIAFGKPGYAYMAYNMARSIRKHSPNIKICLASDGCEKNIGRDYKNLFDQIIHFKPTEAGMVKCSMDLLSPFDHTLYLDVDGCVVKDIEPLLDELIKGGKPFTADVQGTGGLRDKINYGIWAENTTAWAWFDIPMDGKFQAIQSSILYFNEEGHKVFEYARKKYNLPKEYLSHKWGNSTPDELILSGALAHFQLEASMPKCIFFGNRIRPGITRKTISNDYYILSIYGNQRLTKLRYREMYDQLMKDLTGCYMSRQFYNDKLTA